MSATVPDSPKTSYLMCLGLKGLASSTLVSEYESCLSDPKMPCSRDTAKPPATTTASMTSGTHSRTRTLEIENPRFRRISRDPLSVRGAAEGRPARRKKVRRRPDSWPMSTGPVSATSDSAPAMSCTPRSTIASKPSTRFHTWRMSVVRPCNLHITRGPSRHNLQGWTPHASRAAVTSNEQRLRDRDLILTSKPCRWHPYRLFRKRYWIVMHRASAKLRYDLPHPPAIPSCGSPPSAHAWKRWIENATLARV